MIGLLWGRANVRSGYCPVGRMSGGLMSIGLCPWAAVRSGYCPVGLLSGRVSVR